VFAESQRLLSEDRSPTPPPAPAPVPPVVLDECPVEKWKREGTESMRQREATKAEMRREAREEREAFIRARALDGAEARISALEGRMDEVERQILELSRAISDYSDSVNAGLVRQEKRLAELQTLLTERAAIEDQRLAALDLPSFLVRKERRIN